MTVIAAILAAFWCLIGLALLGLLKEMIVRLGRLEGALVSLVVIMRQTLDVSAKSAAISERMAQVVHRTEEQAVARMMGEAVGGKH